jgi:hypothetical protein
MKPIKPNQDRYRRSPWRTLGRGRGHFWPRDPYFAWFDYWLKGEPTGIMDERAVVLLPPSLGRRPGSLYAGRMALCRALAAPGHIGTFSQLEDQMTNFTSDIDRAAAGYSPDRVDALVWAFSELLVEPMESEGVYELARQRAEAAEQRRKPQPTQPVPQPGSVQWFEAQKNKG